MTDRRMCKHSALHTTLGLPRPSRLTSMFTFELVLQSSYGLVMEARPPL